MSTPCSLRVLAAGPLLLVLAGCNSDNLSPLRADRASAMARATAAIALSAGPASTSAIFLSWNDVVRNEAGWEVHRSLAGASETFSLVATLAANSTGHHDAGLGAQTQYCYKVRSFRMRGHNVAPGDFSETACATTFSAPAAPSAVSAVPINSNAVRVDWTDNASDETGIRVERATSTGGPWTTVASLAAGATSWTDHSRTADQMACYRAIAVGAHGDGVSDSDCTVPPARAENITASTTGTSSIDVSWTDVSVAEDGYEVQRSTDGFPFAFLATLPAGSSSYTDASIVPDQLYLYRVRAMRDGGFSTYSDIAAGFTVTGPPAPAAISAYVAGSTVAWVRTGMSPTTTGIRIERSFDGVSGWEQIASMTVSADGANDYLDADRTPEVRVCYRVFASNSFGEAAASNVDCAIPLAQPTDLVITQNPDESYQATWTDNSSNETLYLVSVYLCYPGYWCEWIYDLWLDQSSTFFAAGPNEYPGEIRACSDDGCSDSAAWATSSAASSLKASMMSRMPAAAKDDASASEGVRDLRERITKARRPIRR